MDLDRYRNQSTLDAATDRVDALVEQQRLSGFGRMRNDSRLLATEILWKGTPPPAIRALEGTDPSGVQISITEVRFSRLDNLTAAARIMDAGAERAIPQPEEVRSTRSHDGLLVGFRPETYSRIDRENVQAQLVGISGMPVTIREVEPISSATRANDASPWKGGSQMIRGNQFCTTGFPLVVTSSGAGRLLSAGHCDPSGDAAWNDGNGDSLTAGGADVRTEIAGVDSMIIDPVGGTVGKIHGGPWNAGTGHARYNLSVGGDGGNDEQDLVCVSGSNTGERCTVEIADIDVVRLCPGSATLNCTFDEGFVPAGTTAIAEGDSGGPVYTMRGDGRVSAKAIISGGTNVVTCPASMAAPVGNTCWNRAFVIPIQPILAQWTGRELELAP